MRLRQELFETARKYTEKHHHHLNGTNPEAQTRSVHDDDYDDTPDDNEGHNTDYDHPYHQDENTYPSHSNIPRNTSSSNPATPNILTKFINRDPGPNYTIKGGNTKVSIIDPRQSMGIVQLGKDTIPSSVPIHPSPAPPSSTTAPKGKHLDNIKGSAIVAYNTCKARLQEAETKLRLKQQEHQHAQWETERQIQLVPARVPSEARMAIKSSKINEEKLLLLRRRLEADVEAARLDLLHAQERLDLALGIAANDNAGALSAEFRAKVREEELRKQKQLMGIKDAPNPSHATTTTNNNSTSTSLYNTSNQLPPSTILPSTATHSATNIFPEPSYVNHKLNSKQQQYSEIAEQIGNASIKIQQRVHRLEKELGPTSVTASKGNPSVSFYSNTQDIDPALATYPIPPSVLHGTGGELTYTQRRQRRPQENAWQEAAIREATEARAFEIANLAIHKEQTKNAYIELARHNLEMGETAPDSTLVGSRPPVPPRDPPPRTYVPPPVPRIPPPPPPPIEEPVEEQYMMEPVRPAGAPSGAIEQSARQREQHRMNNLSKRTNKWFSSSAIWDSMNHDQAYPSSSKDDSVSVVKDNQSTNEYYPEPNHSKENITFNRPPSIPPVSSSSVPEENYSALSVPEPSVNYSRGTLVQPPFYSAASNVTNNMDHHPYQHTYRTHTNADDLIDDTGSSVKSATEHVHRLDNYIHQYDEYEEQQYRQRTMQQQQQQQQQSSRVTIVPPILPVPPSNSSTHGPSRTSMLNSTGVQATTDQITIPHSSLPLHNNTKIINATLSTTNNKVSSSLSSSAASTSNTSNNKKKTSLDFLYNGSVAGLPPMRKPTIRQTKPNEWLPAPSANNNPLGPRVMGMQRGETAKGNSTTEDIEKLLARPSVRGGMKKGGSADHTFPRYGVVDIVPGVPPTKPKKGKIKMVANQKPTRLGPKPKLFDWKWPDEKQRLLPGSAEDTAYWRSMSQPKRYPKPAWARDPHGPKDQFW